MSNPTTPFGWQMPQNTDLVTDLPADFEVFGQAVATSMADLLGGTTGQVLSKASNTDMDFTWVTDAAGDITGVTAGTGISGGGTSGTVTVTNSMATAMTTSGDLIQATGSGTFARLATGTNGQYLTTNGTTNSWGSISAGSMTLLATTTLTGASVTVTSIDQTYQNLYIVVRNFLPATDGRLLSIRPNNVSSDYANLASSTDAFTPGADSIEIAPAADNASASKSLSVVTIYDYANTATGKFMQIIAMANNQNAPSTDLNFKVGYGISYSSSAITSIVYRSTLGNMTSGTAYLYGVK